MRARCVRLAAYSRTIRYQYAPMSGPSLLGDGNCAADRLAMTKWRSTRTRSARWSLSLAEWRPTIISSLTSIPAFRDSSPRPSCRSSDTMRYIAIISLFSARLRASTSARSSTSRGASADMYTAARKACAAIPSQGTVALVAQVPATIHVRAQHQQQRQAPTGALRQETALALHGKNA